MRPNSRRLTPIVCLMCALLAVATSACSHSAPAAPVATAPALTPEQLAPLEPGVYDLRSGELISYARLIEALAARRYVIAGESHDEPWHHHAERDLYAALSASRPDRRVLLGMEMFQRPFQSALDAYTTGRIDQAQMLVQTEWEERWRYPVTYYAPLWQIGRAHGAPVVALNAPREISRRVAEVGIDALEPDERAALPPQIDLSNQPHRDWFEGAFGMHGHSSASDPQMFERFYQAQVAWDETMAHSAVETMRARAAEDMMLIVAGSGHVRRGWGIPSRIARRIERPDEVATVLFIGPGAPARRSLQGDSALTRAEFEMMRQQKDADFVIVY